MGPNAADNHGHPLATRCQHLQLALNVFRMVSKLRELFRDPVFPLSVYRVGTKALWVTATTGLNYYWLKPALCTLETIPAEESLSPEPLFYLPTMSCTREADPRQKTPGAGLHDPDGSFPTQHILGFYEKTLPHIKICSWT